MKKTLHIFGLVLLTIGFQSVSMAQQKVPKGLWGKVDESAIPAVGTRYIQATTYSTIRIDLEKLKTHLAPVKRIDDPSYLPIFLDLPRPDGTVGHYQIHENETMSPVLAAQFPEIRSFDGIPLDGSGEIVKLDITPQGFHAMTLTPGKTATFIDPYSFGGGDLSNYIVYDKKDYITNKQFDCQFDGTIQTDVLGKDGIVKSFGSCQKRTYRLALSATGEYTAFHGGSVAAAQAAQVTTMNRVNGVYMIEMAITMTIIANNNLIVYTNSGTDPFTNGDPNSMINQNQTNTTTVIGSANYDIGHVFGTNSGGLAGLGVVCSSGSKASGVTGSGAPIGDAFDIDYVAHEMGHQFAGNHTFRGSGGSCAGNANGSTAYEPGSGSSIMAYAGICSPQNVQNNSDAYFHGVSLQEIGTFITGGSHTCPVVTSIANQSPPTITGTNANVTIPISTPFALTATATDVDGDVLTYCWEQMNNENSTQPPIATSTNGPNFRTRNPTTNPTRYFPSIASQLTNGPYTWEVLPSVTRTMNFRVMVRDNEVNGGCNDEANVTLSTTSTAGPFVVTYPTATGITWGGNSTQTVTWNVANTNVAPVNATLVDVLISTNSGSTFTVLANDVPNDGSQAVTTPNIATTNAIIMVISANGSFFDISNNRFTITASANDYTLSLTNTSISACQGTDAVYSVQVNQIGTYTDPVTLSAVGLPTNVIATFSTNPATPGSTVTLTISNTAAEVPGTYNFTVQGSSTSGIRNVAATLLISSGTASASTLTSPVDAEPSAPIQPTLTWTNSGAGISYDVQIASDVAFTTIVETATALTAATYTATTLLPATTYFWRVNSYNSCSAGAFSTVFSFTTASCGTFASTDVPKAISGTGTPTVTSTLTISTGGIVNDLNLVNLAGTHTYISDLTFRITSPAGTVVTLFDKICTTEQNFDVNFDDEAAPGALPCPPVGGGSYQSAGLLSAFDGENMNGVWTLTVIDNFDIDGGSLDSWGLNICFTPSTPCTSPTAATISGNTAICPGGSTTLTVATGTLNDATNWQWYTGSCGGTSAGSGTSITASAAGTYYVRGEGGCVTAGTCQSIVVTQTTINTNTSLTAGVLSSNQNGATYQWLDCGNANAPISGATNQSFTPTVNGSYSVRVTFSGCTATSNCVTYNSVGLLDLTDGAVLVYPNPTTGIVTVLFGQEIAIDEMNVTDVTGRLVRKDSAFNASSIEIDITKESKGIYFLNIHVGGQIQTLKITKN